VREITPANGPSAPAFNVERARAETPGVRHVVHLNSAGASLMPRAVVAAMVNHLEVEAEIGAYEAAEYHQDALDRVHPAAAALVGCAPDEIAILDSATRAWSLAFASIPLAAGDRVLVSPVEYGSNHLSLLHAARRSGAAVEVLPVDEHGEVDVAALGAAMDDRVRAVVVTHVPSHDGLVNPVQAIGAVVRGSGSGAIYLVDACQSVGQLPIDVDEIGCDLLVGCGRKYLRGPRGTALLYARRSTAERLEPPTIGLDGAEWIDAGDYRLAPGARRFELWEANCAARIGLGVAIDHAMRWGVPRTWPRVEELAERLRAELRGVPRLRLEDRGRRRCGIVALTVDGQDVRAVRGRLRDLGINTWVCLENAAGIDMRARGLRALLRASVHYYNTVEELDRFCAVLESLVVARTTHAVGTVPIALHGARATMR